jgi:hypothetical protein
MRSFDRQGANLTEQLQHHAGENPIEDARRSGYIKAVKDLLQITLDETKETE